MAVPVHFPDGTIRQVPAQLKQIAGRNGIAGATFEQVPLNCHQSWKYHQVGTRWVAVRRIVGVSPLRLPVEDWWQSIATMADERPELPQKADPVMRSAA